MAAGRLRQFVLLMWKNWIFSVSVYEQICQFLALELLAQPGTGIIDAVDTLEPVLIREVS